MSLPPRAPSLSKASSLPPLPKGVPLEESSKYSDRFKTKKLDTRPENAKVDLTSTTEFPTLGRSSNRVLMPNTLPSISFATKVKQMALAEETAKAQAEANRIRRQQEEQRELREREQYASIYSGRTTAAPQEDSLNSPCDEEEWTPGTPEFGREEFLNQEENDDWSNT